MARTTLTPNRFYEGLKHDSLTGLKIATNFEVVLDNSNVDWHYREIKDVVFEEIVRISNVEIYSGLAFIDCEFKSGIVFRNVQATNFNSTYNPNKSCVFFNNCISNHISLANGWNLYIRWNEFLRLLIIYLKYDKKIRQ